MRASLIVLTVVVLLCIYYGVDGSRWRAPRIRWRAARMRWRAPRMRWRAPRIRWRAPRIRWRAPRIRWTGKRSYTEDTNTYVVKLPCKFEAWDNNNDGVLSFEEFEQANPAVNRIENIFHEMDTDGNGNISPLELDSAPLLRETC